MSFCIVVYLTHVVYNNMHEVYNNYTVYMYTHNSEYYLQVLFIIYELPMIVADLLSVTLWPLHVSCST